MYRLLIADDEPLVCVGVQSMLDWKTLDIDCVGTARNGQQAYELIEQFAPDIVITDIKMPIKDGLQLAIECSEKFGRTPVFILLTSYEDFEFARLAIKAQVVDYLVKLDLNENILAESIKKAIEIVRQYKADFASISVLARSNIQALREKFFIRLFNNLFDEDEMYDAQKNDLEINLLAPEYIVSSCEIIPPPHSKAGDHAPLVTSTIQMVRETLAKYCRCHIVPLDMWHFAVVFCLDQAPQGDSENTVREALQQTTALLHGYLNVSLNFALGNAVNHPRKLHISYILSQRRARGMPNAQPAAGSEPAPKNGYAASSQEIRQGIRKAFEELDSVSLNKALSEVAGTISAHPDDVLQAMDTACNILYMAISLLPEGTKLVEQIFLDEAEGYRALYHLRSAESIAAWVCRLRDGCNELLQSLRHGYKEHIVANVKTYIEGNLDKRLSLQEVAAVFNFSPSYLSQLFSKYSAEGFVEFTTSARINASKKMLSAGEFRIYEIAEKLGFESSFYFSKVFKKAEGVSPREYIQKLENNRLRKA